MAEESQDHPMKARVYELAKGGLPVSAIALRVNESPDTIARWLKETVREEFSDLSPEDYADGEPHQLPDSLADMHETTTPYHSGASADSGSGSSLREEEALALIQDADMLHSYYQQKLSSERVLQDVLNPPTENVACIAAQSPMLSKEHTEYAYCRVFARMADRRENIRESASDLLTVLERQLRHKKVNKATGGSWAVQNKRTTDVETLEAAIAVLVRHENPEMRLQAVRHPAASLQHFKVTLSDPAIKVKAATIMHPNMPPDIVQHLTADQNEPFVRKAIKGKLKQPLLAAAEKPADGEQAHRNLQNSNSASSRTPASRRPSTDSDSFLLPFIAGAVF